MTPQAAPLAISLGDPAGIGPEIIVKAYRALRADGPAFLVCGDHDVLAAQARGGVQIRRISTPDEATAVFGEALPLLDLPLRSAVVAGQPSVDHAEAVVRWIETAVAMALTGACSGVVTCPIAKATLYRAGFRFPGHTEFIADLARDGEAPTPVMMLASPQLRVALVTIHLPLSEAPAALTQAGVFHCTRVTAEALRTDFGVTGPRLAVAALNPHAGEDGALGREEIEIIAPAVDRLKGEGLDVTGPLAADTLFHADARVLYDAVICMYHDQALIPLKTLDFWNGVNVTLGLPLVRTSPDHGTGFALAGRGLARPDSLIAAIRMAAEIAARRALA